MVWIWGRKAPLMLVTLVFLGAAVPAGAWGRERDGAVASFLQRMTLE